MHDEKAKRITGKNPNMLVPWYLMAAYAYYVQDDPIITDGCYDSIVEKLLQNWDTITHRHKCMICLDSLRAGTFLGEYPQIVEGAVENLKEEKKNETGET